MLTMSQINHIKDLSNWDTVSVKFLKKLVDPIRKYLSQDDFSPEPPIVQLPIIHWRKRPHSPASL